MVDELTRLLAEREARKQQEFVNSITQRRVALDEAEAKRIADYQRSQLDSIDDQRRQAQAVGVANLLTPDQDINDETADTLTRGNLGILVKKAPDQLHQMFGSGEQDVMNADGTFGIKKAPAVLTKKFTGTPAQNKLIAEETRLKTYLNSLDPKSEEYRALQYELMTGKNAPAGMFDSAPKSKTGIIQEYEYAVANGYKGSFQDYQNEDANRKRPVVNTQNNSWKEQSALAGLNTRFSNSPIVKNFNEVALKAETVRALVDGDWTGPGDLATVFEFMKGLDPTSVVRESEYDSAAKSGNIFRGILARFNGQLSPNGGFLSPEVRKEFKRIVKMKLDKQRQQYNNLAKEYAKQIERIPGMQKGEGINHLLDYAAAFEPWTVDDPAKPAPTTSNTPAAQNNDPMNIRGR